MQVLAAQVPELLEVQELLLLEHRLKVQASSVLGLAELVSVAAVELARQFPLLEQQLPAERKPEDLLRESLGPASAAPDTSAQPGEFRPR